MGTENKYKKGDWVRCVDDSDTTEVKVGEIYKVHDADHRYIYMVDRTAGGMYLHRFEPWQPKVGERVRVVGGSTTNEYIGVTGIVEFDDGASYMNLRISLDKPIERFGDTSIWRSAKHLEPITDPLPVAEQPAALTIQAGRYYKTRDGRKVGPMERNGDKGGHWHWKAPRLEGYGPYWCKNGDFYEGRDEHKNDLVAEWVDTPSKPATNLAATVDAINDEYGPVVREVPVLVAEQPARLHEGAKVRLVRNRNSWNEDCDPLVIGQIVTLTDRDTGISNQTTWEAWNVKERHIVEWVRSDDVELVTPTPSIVALIENGQPLPATRPAVHATVESADAEAKRLAGVHKGQEFGVFILTGATHKEAKVYEHEWQRLAAGGHADAAAASLMKATGMHALPAKHAVRLFAA